MKLAHVNNDTDILSGLMGREEAAQALHVSPRSLDRWHALRTGPHRFRIGGKVVYDRNDLIEWVAQQKKAGT